jgi:hypothetical protein
MPKDAELGWSVLLKLSIVGTDDGTPRKLLLRFLFQKAMLSNCHYTCATNVPAQLMCCRSTGKRLDKPAFSFLRFNRSMARHPLLRIRNVCGVCKINSAWNLVLEETVLL